LSAATIGETVAALTARFEAADLGTPRLDARVLVAHALGAAPAALFARAAEAFPEEHRAVLDAATQRRLRREPVSRILGMREFWGLTFEIGPATLDPRPDTETLVEAALRYRMPGCPARLLDLGTGSGCILLALLSAWPEAKGTGVDVSGDALAVAARNARRLGLEARATFVQGDWCDPVCGRFDLVVANPPYVTDAEMAALPPEVAAFDPAAALRGGPDGLDAYRRIVPRLPGLLAGGGAALLEVGRGQADAVAALLAVDGLSEIRFHRDLADVARVVAAAAPAAEKV
jgi:release factor glutamine methyltransferase